jgi:hypothetical protein
MAAYAGMAALRSPSPWIAEPHLIRNAECFPILRRAKAEGAKLFVDRF